MAPIAIKAGGPSPMGEPLAILPPIVAALRTCGLPYRANILYNEVEIDAIACISSVIVTAAPTRR